MRRASVLVLSVVGFASLLMFMNVDAAAQPARKQSGIDKRVPWTTSKVIGAVFEPPDRAHVVVRSTRTVLDSKLESMYVLTLIRTDDGWKAEIPAARVATSSLLFDIREKA